jgi:PAS domain S-box-containing protein
MPSQPLIMIVDDDTSVRMQVRYTLEIEGFAVIEAANGLEALDLFKKKRPDLVLLDIHMPDLDGFSTCRALRTLPNGAYLPVVMFTSMEDAETITDSFDAGATDFISKPVNLLTLGYRARYWLRSSAALNDLELNQKRLVKAQEIARLAHWELNLETGEFLVTCQAPEIFGLTLPCNFEALFAGIVPEEKEQVAKQINSALLADKAFSAHYRATMKDGSTRIFLTQGEVVPANAYHPRQAIGIIQDISELKQIEERMLKAKATLTMTIDGIPDPLIMLDAESRIQTLNEAAKNYFRLSTYEEAIGKRCFEAFKKILVPCDGCTNPFSNMKGYTGSYERKGIMDPDKIEQIDVDVVKNQAGEAEAFIIRICDITQKKKAERHLVQSEKLASLGLLIAGVAHEINNPNNFIFFNIPILRSYIQFLLPIVDEYAELHANLEVFNRPYPAFREDCFTLLDNIEHGSLRINQIVDSLREFVRERGQGDKSRVNLKEIVEKGLALCMGRIKKTIKTFTTDIPEGLTPLVTDPLAIEQVVVNLLINAIQAADKEDSWVALKIIEHKGPEEKILIEVSDNGCGMDIETQRKIFDPFFTTKAVGVGTGLGLSICYRLVTELGGHIDVESEPGKGSVFRVTLLTTPSSFLKKS